MVPQRKRFSTSLSIYAYGVLPHQVLQEMIAKFQFKNITPYIIANMLTWVVAAYPLPKRKKKALEI